jgi:putative two-component system response regulator
MAHTYYLCMLLLAFGLLGAYMAVWHKHLDVHITLIFVLVPIANLGALLVAEAQTLEGALTATKVTYIGGCYLLLILLLTVMELCDIALERWQRIVLLGISTGVYFAVLTIGHSPLYYEEVTMRLVDGVTVLDKRYGPAHGVFIAMELSYFCASIASIAYSYLRKNQVSRYNLHLLLLTEVVAVVCFFGGRRVLPSIELLPLAYDFALAVYLVIVHRLSLYDIADSAIDSLVEMGETGFASFDFRLRYLGSNKAAQKVFPELCELTVDKPAAANELVEQTLLPWVRMFAEDESENEHNLTKGETSYKVLVQHLYTGHRKRGYQLVITDDTRNQNYIALIGSFNAELQREVDEKTAHIVEMHDNLVLSMAVMVESRDNSTGGHIRRTSEGVRLLVEQMRASGYADLSDDFCRNVIKAAPMHDLGKIAVDDAVLRKPGRFTPEEFEKMKKHAAEGARIVHEILSGTDDIEFHHIAENVAHYHHERWDGSGYPEGLAGAQIPLEARIMAIADVYDALVSKRVYKEAMPFDKADAIIMEGMGTQFDQGLEAAYVAARPQLEAYYRSLDSSTSDNNSR